MSTIPHPAPPAEQVPGALCDDLVALLDRHGIRPELRDDPHGALGWSLVELRAFLAAYRTAPTFVGEDR